MKLSRSSLDPRPLKGSCSGKIMFFKNFLNESLGKTNYEIKFEIFLRYHRRVIGDRLHDFWTGCRSISGNGCGCAVMSSKGIVS